MFACAARGQLAGGQGTGRGTPLPGREKVSNLKGNSIKINQTSIKHQLDM